MSKLYFTVGLPGSGKSHWAETHKDELNAVVHSSDAIRKEFGDENDQSKNELVFNTLHKRIKEDLLSGKNVIVDQTGINRKRRIHFLSNILKDVSCEKVCVLFATPYEICLKNNANRERKVPEDVIFRMYKNFEVPFIGEGWDDIQIVWWDWNKDGIEFDFYKDLDEWRTISQDSPHHTLSIGDHMISASNHYTSMCKHYEDYSTEDRLLSMAILMHDCGKVFTKTFVNKDGSASEKARFFEHHNVGSYLSLFYLKEMFGYKVLDFTDDEILYISLLINCHMRHFMAYNDSNKSREKDRKLFGDDFMNKLDILHECDLVAH